MKCFVSFTGVAMGSRRSYGAAVIALRRLERGAQQQCSESRSIYWKPCTRSTTALCSSQLILFDACANNFASGAMPASTVTTWEDEIDQVCISSAARGEYASSDDRSSYFARIVLSLLKGYDTGQIWMISAASCSRRLRLPAEVHARVLPSRPRR